MMDALEVNVGSWFVFPLISHSLQVIPIKLNLHIFYLTFSALGAAPVA